MEIHKNSSLPIATLGLLLCGIGSDTGADADPLFQEIDSVLEEEGDIPSATGAARTSSTNSFSTDPPIFGSRAVLTQLWSAQQLEGAVRDRQVRRLEHPDRRPPARLTPQTILPAIKGERRHLIRRAQPFGDQKLVALTFDLCESEHGITGYDRDVVNALRAHDAAATFFAGGKWMRSHPTKAMQLMADPAFEIGNHSWSHEDLRLLEAGRVDEQIEWTQAQYELLRERLYQQAHERGLSGDEIARIPNAPTLFRFPYGSWEVSALQRVADHGLLPVQYDVVSGDPSRKMTKEKMARRVLEGVRPGSIVLFHANGRGLETAVTLPTLLRTLLSRGYRFVTVSDLLNAESPVVVEECH